ncbi:MAG: hypothetical protein WA036_08195, partial [Streptococcus suis]
LINFTFKIIPFFNCQTDKKLPFFLYEIGSFLFSIYKIVNCFSARDRFSLITTVFEGILAVFL